MYKMLEEINNIERSEVQHHHEQQLLDNTQQQQQQQQHVREQKPLRKKSAKIDDLLHEIKRLSTQMKVDTDSSRDETVTSQPMS